MTTPYEEGTPDRPICVLGEAPARMEMKFGAPLVGPAGEVFNDCLRVAGIARQECYILNVFPFPVDKNRTDDIIYGGRVLWNHRHGFTEDGLEAAAPTIRRLQVCQANVVLTLGRPSLNLMAGKTRPLLKWRGSSLWSDEHQKKYLPTIHPAATLWGGPYIWRYLIQSDMAKAKLEMDSPLLKVPYRELHIQPTLTDVYHYIHECRSSARFATDLEVMNHQVSCFSLSTNPQSAMTVPLVGPDGSQYWDEDDEALVWKWYAELMSDPEIMKVNQNIVGFDTPFLLMQNNIHTKGPIGDTMIAQHILYPHFPKGLDFIASYHTREPYWKDEGKIWKANHKIDWHTFQRYCAKDAAVALEAWDVLSTEMTDGGYWPTYYMTVEMQDALSYMAVRGLAVDHGGLEATKKQLEVSIEEKQTQLDLLTGGLNPNSPAKCKEYFYEKLGLKPYLNHNGGITTDDKAMSRIYRKAGAGAKEAKLIQEIRGLRKLKGTYVDVQLDKDSRLRCSWNPRGTWTGRLSSSKTILGTGMNLQNLHPEFKGFIVAG